MPITPYGAIQMRNYPVTFIGGFSVQSNSGNGMSGSQLQSAISSASSGIGELPPGVLHHPISCTDKLYYDEEGALSCEHFEVPPNDQRTKACLIHSVALMLIEEAFLNFTGMKELPFDRYTTDYLTRYGDNDRTAATEND